MTPHGKRSNNFEVPNMRIRAGSDDSEDNELEIQADDCQKQAIPASL